MKYGVTLLLILMLVGCQPQPAQEQVIIPTMTPTPDFSNTAGNAELVVRTFLDNWQDGDYAGMYNQLSYASQQATDFDTFQRIYETASNEMRLESLTNQLLVEKRESNRVMLYNYNTTFSSRIVGEFSDENREIRLVMDDIYQDWRVAWSPADIFADMGRGGSLRLETFTPTRANIYDRNGEILADMNGSVVTVSIIPGEIPNLETCTNTLTQVMAVSVEDVQAQLANYRSDQLAEVTVIERGIYDNWGQALQNDCAARLAERATRRYRYSDLISNVVGYVGYPESDQIEALQAAGFRQDSIIGRSGIEETWDETLRGVPGGRLTIVSPGGEQLRLLAERGSQPAQSVYLTIDINLQRKALQTIIDMYASGTLPDSNGAALTMLDIHTGEILAMVSYPTFNANAFTPYPLMGKEEAQRMIQETENDPRRPLLNRPTQGSYPTGSVMKLVTAIAALDSGVFRIDERFVSTGVWNRDIPRFDWLAGGHGSLTLANALTHSCNTCFYEAGYRLDQSDPYLFSQYANMLGLGVTTGLTDLPEVTGLIGNPDNKADYESTIPWSFSDAVNIAIGQGGVQVTPLQLLEVYSTVADGGTVMRPQLVQRVGLLDEFSYELTPDPMRQINIPLEILDFVRSGLCEVTTAPYGTATHIFRNSSLQTIGVCAKTGTATSAGGSSFPHAWFAAYAPRENPQVAIVTMVENAGDGSAFAAPITRDVLEYYFFNEE